MALCDGVVRIIEREEGEATVHPSTLMHAVTMMERDHSRDEGENDDAGMLAQDDDRAAGQARASHGLATSMMMRYSLIVFFGRV